MSPKTVKRIFLFFIFYLPIQYISVGVIGLTYSEPWPAFVLPGFKNVYADHDEVKILQPEFIAYPKKKKENGFEVKASLLFEGIPQSQLQGFLESSFRNQREFSRDATEWFSQRLEKLYPQQSFSELRVQWDEVTYSNNKIVNRKKAETLTIPLVND